MAMTTEQQVSILAVITTQDEAGRHFTARYDHDALIELEEAGLLAIRRPVHEATGISYSQEYWSVEVTQAGADLVEANPEYCPEA
jgi:hypothetical protein